MNVINLTPHAICVQNGGGMKVYPGAETPARVSFTQKVVGQVDGFAVSQTEYGEVTGLPPQSPDTFYIVSMLVKSAAPDRRDLLCPDSGRAIRGADGQIIAVPGFIS
jgi:hypothetical protein